MDKVRRIAGTVLLGGLLLGLMVCLAGQAGIAPVLRALGTPADILPQATAYARVMLLALPAMFLTMLAGSILRGLGDTVTPAADAGGGLHRLDAGHARADPRLAGLAAPRGGQRGLGEPRGQRLRAGLAGLAPRASPPPCPGSGAARALPPRRAHPEDDSAPGHSDRPLLHDGVAGRPRPALAGASPWLGSHRGLGRREPGDGLRAVPRDVDRHGRHGVHRTGHRRAAMARGGPRHPRGAGAEPGAHRRAWRRWWRWARRWRPGCS